MIKSAGKTIKNEVKEQEVGFLSLLLGKLGASLLRSSFRDKGMKAKKPTQRVIRSGEEVIRAG